MTHHNNPRPKAQGPRPLFAMALLLSCLFSTTAIAQTTWPDLGKAVETQADGGKDAALIVGIEDYAYLPDIPGAVSNISAWYLHLRKTRGLPLDHIKLLRNNQATREEILTGMDAVLAKVQPGGTLWVVFIGHGAPSSKGEGLLIGVDAQQKASSVASRGVAQRELLQRIRGGKQAQAVVLLDACFSGLDQSGQALVKGVQPMVPVRPEAAPDKTLVLTAARSNQFAGALPGAKRPAFSYLMLGAIRGWADKDKNGLVEASEAFEYTRQALDVLVTDHRQQPQLIGDSRGINFGQSLKENGPDLDEMRLALATAPAKPEAIIPERPHRENTGERRRSGHQTLVRIEALNSGESFDAMLVSPSGERFECEEEVTAATPCILHGVPPGTARVNITGDINESKNIPVVIGSTRVDVAKLPLWPYVAGGVLVAAGFASFLAGTSSREEAFDEAGNLNEPDNTSFFLGAGGFFLGGITGGLSIYYGFRQRQKTDGEQILVTSIPDGAAALPERRPFQLGLAPLDGGAMLNLGFEWD